MRGKVRNFFPGGNTSKGFYSYYQYICAQDEAEKIVFIKGGPGTGKSTFMKSVAEHFLDKGENVDLFWCSADPDSLDAILLRNRHIAFMDGTSPHVMDPQNPGAVDTILHIGDYWDDENIKKNRDNILKSGNVIKKWYDCAYAKLAAAAVLQSLIKKLYSEAISGGELYKAINEIIERELSGKPVTISEGRCRKYFASAITCKGNLTHIKSLIRDCKKVYLIASPSGFDMAESMKRISQEFIHRGYSIEQYYCPMDPEHTIEHILIPALEVGFITLNDNKDSDAWKCDAETVYIDIWEFVDWNYIEKYREVIDSCEKGIRTLTEHAIKYLGKAKQEHDVLEGYYISCMNFEKIEKLTSEWICKIERKEL